jgi:TonB family protein
MSMTTQFALCLFLMFAPAAPQSQVARDTPPPSIENARRERDLRAMIEIGTATKDTYLELATVLNKLGRPFDAVQVLRNAAALDPSSAEASHRVATYLWDAVRQATNLDAETKRRYIKQGIEDEDRALAIRPDYPEALTYKNILLRLQANTETDPVEQKRLIDEADVVRNRMIEMQRQKQGAGNPAGATPPPAPPAAPFAGFAEPFDQTLARIQPVRVGGNVRTPTKVRDVKPVYPPEAQAARVQGVVIIEALIDDRGEIANAHVLRSIPMLDDAALGAVSQWKFTPTEVNGMPVPVIMTVTVNFTLMQ